MAASGNFVVNDSDLAFNVQMLFHDYVATYKKLHYPDSKNAISNAERRELASKMQGSINEINLLVLKMKRFQPDTEIVTYNSHQTISASRQSSRISAGA
jgi:hypothetical protein